MNNSSGTFSLFPQKEDHGTDYVFLLYGSFFAAITALIATIVNIFLPVPGVLTLSTTIGILFYFLIYLVIRKYANGLIFKIAKWVICIGTFIFLDLLWFFNYGSSGPILYIILLFFIILLLLWRGKERLYMILLYLLNITGLFVFEFLNSGQLGIYADRDTMIIDRYSGLYLSGILSVIMIGAIMRLYNREKEKAILSDRLKSAFLANLSHEVRTPMNAILGFSQLLKEKSIGEDVKIQNYTSIIHSNGHFLMQLLDDMIDISKIEAGEIELKPEKFNLKEMFEELHSIYSIELINAGKKDIVISWELKLPDDYIFTDKLRIRQIISNLLNNSLKFTSNGSIIFSAKKEEGKVIFCVKDTGIGIPVENHRDVFKRFIKLTNDPNIKGTGIGLSIASDLVRILGGQMGIKSQTGMGSEFEFYIPEVTIP